MSFVVRTVLFTLLVPGSVAGLVPWLIATAPGPRSVWLLVGERHLVGLLPMALGVALYLACAGRFVVEGRGTPAPIDPPRRLVVRGVYRWVRNPMYVAVLTVLLGEVLLSASAWLAAYAALVWLVFQLFVRLYEEPHLAAQFGESYRAYAARVPRWVPRRPRSP